MELKITMIEVIEDGNTSTTKTKFLTEKQYENITNDAVLKFFRRLGGSETAKRGYTSYGYVITKLISRNHSKTIKITRTFGFEYI